jgi:hypothetical protein
VIINVVRTDYEPVSACRDGPSIFAALDTENPHI